MVKEPGFNLFGAEEKILAGAEALAGRLNDVPADLRDEIATLIEAYQRSVREQRRLVRVSDRLQGQMATMNQELARRRAEAEEALSRLETAQDQLVQTEKLAGLGALVAGVAHEINTPVGIALGCASHLADTTRTIHRLFAADDVGIEDFERYMETAGDTAALILANCERAAELIRSFKQVAVDRTSEAWRTYRLDGVIRETMASLGPNLRHASLAVDVACPADLAVDGDPGVLSQILTNLAMNAMVHGYDSGQGGTLSITVDQPAEDMVRLIFADDGKGIAEQHLPRIFDPFFTTRRGSGGTGLGLHIVHNLVRGPLGGTLTADSREGDGTTITVTFPVSGREHPRAPDGQ